MMSTRNYAAEARAASGINILLGVWLLVSPWVFGYQAAGSAAIWNSVIVGALIAIFAAGNCFSRRIRTSCNWINVLLAVWTMLSPLVYGYAANIGGFGDNLVLAILIAAFAICSDEAAAIGEKHLPPSAPVHSPWDARS
jgi:SPW repeat